MLVGSNELPASDAPTMYDTVKHRNGDLINIDGKVYLINNNALRYVGGAIYNSYNWPWDIIMPATSQDLSIPSGTRETYREGTVLYDGVNIFIVKVPATGDETKSPIGPWECYANDFRYTTYDLQRVNSWELPSTTGQRITCI
jgi:hypothetical protein